MADGFSRKPEKMKFQVPLNCLFPPKFLVTPLSLAQVSIGLTWLGIQPGEVALGKPIVPSSDRILQSTHFLYCLVIARVLVC